MKLRMKSASQGLAFLLALSVATVAHADTSGFQAAVQGEATLGSHWTFDGANDAERLLDSGPSNDPLTVVGPAPSYVSGFDTTSTASDIGAADGYRTLGDNPGLGNFTEFTESFTVEYIFNMENTSVTGTWVASALLSSPGLSRLYLGRQQSAKLRLTLGENENTEDIIAADDYNEDEWYYVAINVVEGATDWVANAWYANLTAGETTLNHSIEDWSTPFNANTDATTLPGNKPFGVGRFGAAGSEDGSGIHGLLDDLAFYESALSGSTLQGHLDALLGTAVANGDFDNDGDVDGADFLDWQRGTHTASDLTLWQTTYGASASTVTANAVPEPTALVMVGCMIVGLGMRFRGRQ